MEEIAIHTNAIANDQNNTEPQPAPSGNNWWSFTTSLIDKTLDKVKQQSESLISIYKEDLQEFSQTIQNDTKEVIKKLPQEQEKLGLTNLFGFGSKQEGKHPPVIADRQKTRLLALQSELSTYCTDPADLEEFQAWKNNFQISAHTEEISTLLSSNEKIREIHTKVVPVAVTYKDFWERYFFKLHKLNQEEERRAALVKKASSTGAEEEEVGWDIEDEEIQTHPEEKQAVENYMEKLDVNEIKKQETPEIKPDSPKEVEVQPTTPKESPKEIPKAEIPNKQERKERKKGEDVEDGWEAWE